MNIGKHENPEQGKDHEEAKTMIRMSKMVDAADLISLDLLPELDPLQTQDSNFHKIFLIVIHSPNIITNSLIILCRLREI